MRIVYFNTSGINKSGLAKADDEIVHHLSFWTGFLNKKQTIYEVNNVFIIIANISIPWPLCRCDISQVTYSGASIPSVSMTALPVTSSKPKSSSIFCYETRENTEMSSPLQN